MTTMTLDDLCAPSTQSLTAAQARVLYPDHLTLREARARYFARAQFDDKTYTDRWIELPLGPFVVKAPNAEVRRRAVKIHDLSHVLSGYGTDWRGEFLISAYELGAGMGPTFAGWLINAGGAFAGLWLTPRAMVAAFARGRAQRRSLYVEMYPLDDAQLERTVGELRAHLGVVDEATPTAGDVVRLGANGLAGLLFWFMPMLAALGAVASLAWAGGTLLQQ